MALSRYGVSFMMTIGSGDRMSRRRALQTAAGALICVCAKPTLPALALKPGKPSKEKLLNRTREERTPEEIAEEREQQALERKERLERQRELAAAAERRRQGLEVEPNQADLEANLRASYYYPQARKRYLPRVRRAHESLPLAEKLVASGNWAEASALAGGTLEDAVLPMQLYASSLAGQGLSLAPKFVQKMNDEASHYEAACKRLKTACKKRDTNIARELVADMTSSIARYRGAGRLEADDFGIGEVPTDNRVGSGFGNNNPALEIARYLTSTAVLLTVIEFAGLLVIICSSECHETTWLSGFGINRKSGLVKLFESHPIGTIL
eukprot:IDg14247t1